MAAETFPANSVATRWIFPYLLDWNLCGDGVFRFRFISTAFRWFDLPTDRVALYSWAAMHWRQEWPAVDPEHERNIVDLLYAPIWVPPTLPAGRVALFFEHLHGGNLSTGGLTTHDVLGELRQVRPGYAWTLGRWLGVGLEMPLPWPFWMFPVQTLGVKTL